MYLVIRNLDFWAVGDGKLIVLVCGSGYEYRLGGCAVSVWLESDYVEWRVAECVRGEGMIWYDRLGKGRASEQSQDRFLSLVVACVFFSLM